MLEFGRGFVAVLAGYAAMTLIVIFTSLVLAGLFPGPTVGEPSQAYIVGNLVFGFLAAVAGGFVAAVLAPSRPLLHTAVLSAVVILLGIVFLTSEPEAGQPAWYPAVIVALGASGAFLGGFLRARRVEPIT